MVAVITGSNSYMTLQALKELTSKFVGEYGEFGLERYDASETETNRLLEVVSSVPFLSGKRLVVINNISSNKELGEQIEQFLDSINDTTDIIIYEQKIDNRLNLYKTLKKRTEVREYNELDERELSKWLVAEAQNRGGELKLNDALYIIERAGTNQMLLSGELDKLISYNPSISRSSIKELIEPLPLGSVFDLLDAAFAGNRKKAMDLYESQRKQQAEPQYIMGMIGWQLHILTLVKHGDGKGPDEIAKRAKLNPYVVRKAQNLTRGISHAQLKDILNRALKLDVRLKTEMIDADDAVQHFLLTI